MSIQLTLSHFLAERCTGKKTPGGAGTRDTRDTDTRITGITQTNLTTIPHNHPDPCSISYKST